MPSLTPATLPPPTQSTPASQKFKPRKAYKKSLVLPSLKVPRVLSPMFASKMARKIKLKRDKAALRFLVLTHRYKAYMKMAKNN